MKLPIPRATLILAALALANAGVAAAQLVAFPGAEGAGAHAIGGRHSNNVYVVSNLNDSGVGSLRHAIDSAPSTGRTIVFGVGGTINLNSDIQIDSPYITIAGQTAPQGGVTLARRALRVANTHDVILQHIAVRPGDYYTAPNVYEPDTIWVSGSEDVILDHVSTSWSTDELLSVTHGSTNVTVQWSLITEALHNSNHSKGNHGYGSIIHGGETTLHHNLYANNRSRNPATGNWDKNAPITPAHLDIVNNVISNPGDRYSYSGGEDQYEVNWAGNFGVEGPDTSREGELFHPDNLNTLVYYEGNYYDTTDDGILQVNPAASSTLRGAFTRVHTPIATTNPPVMTDAPLAYAQVLSYAGSAAWRDPIDKRIINDVINQSGRHIDSQDQVGGWHTPAPTTHQLDPDGLPDWWKTANGFDPNDNAVGLRFAQDGYTYLEKYLHELNSDFQPPTNTQQIGVSTAFGVGGDAQVGEVQGASTGSGAGDSLNSQWTTGEQDHLVLLRFDLSGVKAGSVVDASLELTAFADSDGATIRAYGLKHELDGQDWDEGVVVFGDAPGVDYDASSGTRDLDQDDLLLLGEFNYRGADEGEVLSFANPDLTAFLNLLAYRDGDDPSVTLLLERRDNSLVKAAFASKEASALATGGAGQAGDYAPLLVLQAVAVAALPGDYNNDGSVDAADYTVWRERLGQSIPLPNEADSPGVVDQADYVVWRSNYGATFAGQAPLPLAIPEPESVATLATLATILGSLRAARQNPAVDSDSNSSDSNSVEGAAVCPE